MINKVATQDLEPEKPQSEKMKKQEATLPSKTTKPNSKEAAKAIVKEMYAQ